MMLHAGAQLPKDHSRAYNDRRIGLICTINTINACDSSKTLVTRGYPLICRMYVARVKVRDFKRARTAMAKGAITRTAWSLCAKAARGPATFCADHASRGIRGMSIWPGR